MKSLAIFTALALASATSLRFAAFDDAPTVKVKDAKQPGGYVVRDAATYDEKKHGPLFEEPEPNSQPAPSPTVAPPQQTMTGAPQTPPAPAAAPSGQAPAPSGYADPADAAKGYFIAEINGRFYLTNAQGLKFQKGQSATGYETKEAAGAKAAELTAAAAAHSA